MDRAAKPTLDFTRLAMERGIAWERERILRALDGYAYAASISPNGEVTSNVLAALRGEITDD